MKNVFIKSFIRSLKRKISELFVRYNYPKINDLPLLPKSDEGHMCASLEWLCFAQDVTHCGGVSASYNPVRKKWDKPYRETTGYIIETFIEYFHKSGDQSYLDRAIRMGEWELSVQCEDGAFGELKNDKSVEKKVFNTGQVILGLTALFQETKDVKYFLSAKKAAQWLLEIQEIDGRWERFTTQGARTYHSRVSWSLLRLYDLTGDTAYLESARKNITWIMNQQGENYWFDKTSLSEENSPWTHLIAYTISGLLECYILLGASDKRLFNSFYGSAKVLLDYFMRDINNYLPCSFDKNWQSRDVYSCLTGNAQLAIIWMQIYKLTREKIFFVGAHAAIEQIKRTQILDTDRKEIRGGVFGSFPIWGDYASFLLINWAAKFFVDSLLLKQEIKP